MKYLIVLIIAFVTCHGIAQDTIDVRVSSNEAFMNEYNAMVVDLAMNDSVTTEFHKIYTEYGSTMKEAYENRTSWTGLNHVYQWAKRDRDSKMKAILSIDQFDLYKERQALIESNARKRHAEEKRAKELNGSE